ncbi:PRC-barrel domain-containing protein [Pedobacter sp. P351]|uniref:PRC-barrel domain-containing protein n=1 Tax=Pedobacter superstes TaxID=3133441 RepID=UPI0030A993C5
MSNNKNNPEYIRIKELGSSKYEVAKHESDIRDWTVKNGKGRILGKVNDLLFDIESNKVLYLVLDLEGNEMHLRDRKVLVPIGIAEVHEAYQNVVFPGVMANELTELPTYEKGKVSTRVEDVVQHAFANTGDQVSDKSQSGKEAYYEPSDTLSSQRDTASLRPQTVIGVFEHTTQGQVAIEHLLENNFHRNEIEVSGRRTENQDGETENHDNGVTNWFKSVFGNDDDARAYTEAAKTGCVITVQTSSIEEAEKAARILDKHGALSIKDSFSNQSSNYRSRILDRDEAKARWNKG